MPIRCSSRSRRRPTSGGSGSSPCRSSVPGTSRAPHSETISSEASASAWSGRYGSRPFSQRDEPSVRSPSRVEDAWVAGPSKFAHSSSTVVVESVTSLHSAPISPAIADGFSASAMTSVSVSSVRCWPSSVVTGSPSAARRTMISRPATLSRSKAWVGSPRVSIT